MPITIPGVPEFLTREQYADLTRAVGFDPLDIQELRWAADGVHALVFYRDPETGARVLDQSRHPSPGYIKHRVFIPVRDLGDTRTARITPVK